MFREPFDLEAPHRHLLHLGPHSSGPFVLTRRFGVPSYDFDFELRLTCRHPMALPDGARCIARLGPIADYEDVHARLVTQGLRLINDPAESKRANDLTQWAPLLGELTPQTLVFDADVDVEKVENVLGYPLFIKTVQQTLAHRRDLAFADNREQLMRSIASYRADAKTSSQPLAIRRRVPLRRLKMTGPAERVPSSVEYRVFLHDGTIVGIGAYWTEGRGERLSEHDELCVRELGAEAYRRLRVPFLAVDVGQLEDRSFLVIETNDGQESGYTSIDPESMWQAIIAQHARA